MAIEYGMVIVKHLTCVHKKESPTKHNLTQKKTKKNLNKKGHTYRQFPINSLQIWLKSKYEI
jgi:hypothetical protein